EPDQQRALVLPPAGLPLSSSHIPTRRVALRDGPGDAARLEGLGAIETERIDTRTARELQREDAHADQVAAVDSLVTLRNHHADALQARSLGGPVAARSAAVLGAGEHD